VRDWIYKRLEAIMDHIIGGLVLAGVLAVISALAVIVGTSGKRHAITKPRSAVVTTAARHTRIEPASPRKSELEEVQSTLARHFERIRKEEYVTAWNDLVGEAQDKPKNLWIEGEETSHLELTNLRVAARLVGVDEAVARIIYWHTEEEGSCKEWPSSGKWRLIRSPGGWLIKNAEPGTPHKCN